MAVTAVRTPKAYILCTGTGTVPLLRLKATDSRFGALHAFRFSKQPHCSSGSGWTLALGETPDERPFSSPSGGMVFLEALVRLVGRRKAFNTLGLP